MKAAFYQFNPVFGEKEDNLNKIVEVVRQSDAELLVLPEFFATGYQFLSTSEVAELAEPVPNGLTTETISKLSREKGMYIVAGLPERDGEKYYNSAILSGPDGFMGLYRKTHLFFEETLYFMPGDKGFKVWDTPVGRIGIMICFDWFFPESMRSLALLGAEVVAHPSNLVLPFCPDAMPVRCLENRVFAITANRIGTESRKADQTLTFIGKSEIVSPKGEILIRASDDSETIMIADIDPAQANDKKLNPYNDVLKDIRQEQYQRGLE